MDIVFSDSSEDNYYSILGCTELSSPEQIETEYKIRAKECHPDRIVDLDQKTKAENAFMALNKAHSILGDPETKEIYDKWKRSGLKVTFDQFYTIQSRCHHSIHWATPKPQPSLTSQQQAKIANDCNPSTVQSTNHLSQFRLNNQPAGTNNLLRDFRSYKL